MTPERMEEIRHGFNEALPDILEGKDPMDRLIRLNPTIERVPNNPRHEWLFSVVDGLAPARAKRLIVQAAMPEVGFLDPGDAEVLLNALGLMHE